MDFWFFWEVKIFHPPKTPVFLTWGSLLLKICQKNPKKLKPTLFYWPFNVKIPGPFPGKGTPPPKCLKTNPIFINHPHMYKNV